MRRRLLLLLIAGAAATGAGGSVGTDVASAHYIGSSSGCTGVSGGITCFYVYGLPGTTHVDHFLQSRDLFSLPTICNYRARFTVAQGGSVYYTKWSNYHSGCFYSFRATRSSGTVERNFRDNSTGCGTWYENGSAMGTACVGIYR